jgi:hypothetical protein
MPKVIETLSRGTVRPARKLYDKLEAKILIAEGRRSVRRKTRVISAVAKKAAKAGLAAGVLTAAAVVTRELRKRRVED